jgi:AcrR family transcriptional regulator
MPRPARFDRDGILDAARTVVSRLGPDGATLKVLAHQLGAPTGSIYYRFPSRNALLATLWLETVESFQQAFLEAIAESPTPASAARFTVEWVREHPREARILILYRREELTGPVMPEPVMERARRLNTRVGRMLRDLARRWFGKASPRNVDAVRLAVVEVPYAAVRSRLARNEPIPAHVSRLVGRAAAAIISETQK